MQFSNVALVAKLDLRQRVRATNWRLSLGLWALAMFVVLMTLRYFIEPLFGVSEQNALHWVVVFDALFVFSLAITLLVTATLSATAINGDRRSQNLAVLQVTPLSSKEIVLGKIMAAWVAAMCFYLVALPFMLVATWWSGLGFFTHILAVLTASVVLWVVCCLGVYFSTVTPRQASSTSITFLVVLSLVLAPVVLTTLGGKASAITYTYETHRLIEDVPGKKPMNDRVDQGGPSEDNPRNRWRCQAIKVTEKQENYQYIWWVNLANPFVLTAMPLGRLENQVFNRGMNDRTPPEEISPLISGVSSLKQMSSRPGHEAYEDACVEGKIVFNEIPQGPEFRAFTVHTGETGLQDLEWVLALLLYFVGGYLTYTKAAKRLELPMRKLPRNTRVA
ncbi:hypothetical protein BK816_00880 [Boudabousia tangfeifanii]|uniref:ABC transporter permease n=2 Tax=Boudabousia tangfeifanii TaxID=1912795 RepID=A0A1D9MI94_9ACTO|nr:hypothetical protein BK816_00880 [Boudabousia tangfeifanii]